MIRLTNYDHIIYGIDRLNYCSLLMNSIPLSSSKSQIQSSLLDMTKVLSTSKQDIENLIQHIYYSICSTSSSYPLSMKDVYIHFRIFIFQASSNILSCLFSQLTSQDTPTLSSCENTFDSPESIFLPSSPVPPFYQYTDEPLAFNNDDPFLLEDQSNDFWKELNDSVEVVNPNERRIAVPPPLFDKQEEKSDVPQKNNSDQVILQVIPQGNPQAKPQLKPQMNRIIKKEDKISLEDQYKFRNKRPLSKLKPFPTSKTIKKDEDEEYKADENEENDNLISKRKSKTVLFYFDKLIIQKNKEEEKKIHLKPKWCHQCKARKRDVIQCCGEGKPRGANNQMQEFHDKTLSYSCFRAYCAKCLKKHYGEDYNEIKKKGKKWLCPGCRDACSCAACVRKRYADPRDIPDSLQTKRNSRFFKTNKKLIREILNSN